MTFHFDQEFPDAFLLLLQRRWMQLLNPFVGATAVEKWGGDIKGKLLFLTTSMASQIRFFRNVLSDPDVISVYMPF